MTDANDFDCWDETHRRERKRPRKPARVRPIVTPAPCGLVQVVRVTWSKWARGGAGARARNAVPLALPIASGLLLQAGGHLAIGESHWGDRDGFAEPFRVRQRVIPVASGFRLGCVGVAACADGLLVRYQWNMQHGGLPNRWYLDAGASETERMGQGLAVRAGEWVRVSANGGFTDFGTGAWWYEQVTVNVAWFAEQPMANVFVASSPARELRLLARLW